MSCPSFGDVSSHGNHYLDRSTIFLWESNNIRATQLWMQSGRPVVKRVLVLYKTTGFLHELPMPYHHRVTILVEGLGTS